MRTKVYATGLVHMSVCTDESVEDMLRWVNKHHPTGIEPKWQLSDDKIFHGGTPNPGPCERSKHRTHYLLVC